MSPKISVNNLWFSYPASEIPVLRNVNLNIEERDIFVLAGQCGCGKSTLAKLLVGLLQPSKGSITIDGRNITGISETRLVAIRKKVGYLFQNSALISNMTSYNNIALPARYHLNLPAAESEKLIVDLIRKVGLFGYENRLPAELSIGQRKRAAVARALVMDPSIMIYDEPTAGLDPINSLGITDIIKERYEERKTTSFIITHDLPFAFSIATRIAFMYRGKIIFCGKPDEVFESGNPYIKEFLGSFRKES